MLWRLLRSFRTLAERAGDLFLDDDFREGDWNPPLSPPGMWDLAGASGLKDDSASETTSETSASALDSSLGVHTEGCECEDLELDRGDGSSGGSDRSSAEEGVLPTTPATEDGVLPTTPAREEGHPLLPATAAPSQHDEVPPAVPAAEGCRPTREVPLEPLTVGDEVLPTTPATKKCHTPAVEERTGPHRAGVCAGEGAPVPSEHRRGGLSMMDVSSFPVYDGAAPRILWTYWDQGSKDLPAFNRLCLQTWSVNNPQWSVRLVDAERLKSLVPPNYLPPTFDSLELLQHKADCAKLALLHHYGGIYLDSSIIVWKDLAEVIGWREIEERRLDFIGYFCRTREFVENWFMACRQGCPLIKAWKEVHLEFWRSRTQAGNLDETPFFEDVDLHDIDPFERNYLVQHACYRILLRRRDGICTQKVRLRDAQKLLLIHHVQAQSRTRCPSVSNVTMRMLMCEDKTLLAERLQRQQIPLIKFTGHFSFLTTYTTEDFFRQDSMVGQLFQMARKGIFATSQRKGASQRTEPEYRWNPDDNYWYTYDLLHEACDRHTSKEIDEWWYNTCVPKKPGEVPMPLWHASFNKLELAA